MRKKAIAKDASLRFPDLLNDFGGRWSIPILVILRNKARFFNELRRAIPGISAHSLARNLRRLECDGVIQRLVHSSAPPRVAYSLTPLGTGLAEAAEPLRKWTETHGEDVLDCRRAQPPS